MVRRVLRPAAGIALAWWVLGTDLAQAQSCTPTGTNQTCTNSTVLSNAAAPAAIIDTNTLTVTNTASGVIGTVTTSGHDGIDALGAANVTNFGAITGDVAISAGSANITNSGTISGAQFGVFTQGDATVSNSGTISSLLGGPGVAGVLSANGNVTVTNSGTIAGGQFAVAAFMNVTVVNSGSMIGTQFAVFTPQGNLTLTNSGSISGGQVGVFSPNGALTATNTGSISGQFGVVGANLALINAGAINGSFVGVNLFNGTVTNAGSITGGEVGVAAARTASVTNSGVISSPKLAIALEGDGSTLTLARGSTIIGGIALDGTGNFIHVNAPNQNLTFTNPLAGNSVDGGVLFVVIGNRIVSIDPTQFATTDRNLLAVIGAISGVIGNQSALPAGNNGRALGFAGPSYTAATAEEAFGDLLGYAKAPNDAVVFKNPSVTFGNGSMVWAKGFIGQRAQGTDGLVLRNVTNFYGGMIGVDGWIAPDLKLGAYGGAGHSSTHIDFNAGSAASDFGFGGIYGRKDLGRVFVDFDIIGGGSSNTTSRTINNNTVASGFETATASFGGWFVSPEIAVGYRHEVWPGFTLTPAARLRYLAAGFDAYTESGSTANLSMTSRVAQALEERVEATLGHVNDLDEWGRLQLAGTVGLVGQERVGASTLNATLLGQALAFATPGKSAIGGLYLSGNADWKTPYGATLFAGADYTAYSDASTIVTGRAGLRVGF